MSDYYMPDELLTKIHTYLPAKSLVRFTCVCKSWYSLITSSDFITDHLNQTRISNSNNDKDILMLRYDPEIPNNELISLHVDNGRTLDLYENLDFPFQSSKSESHVYGSCNGLILLSSDKRVSTPLTLWNPSIRKSLTLPCHRFVYAKYYHALGFGFDSRTNDYKVVRLVYRKLNGNVSPKVELYRLSTRSWETITAPFDRSCFFCENYVGEVFMNGRVHWCVSKMGSSIIMSFNMSDEKFSEIMPPASLDVKSRFKLAVCREWLSLFDYPNCSHCSVWAMKKYGVVESWTKLYTFDLHHKNLRTKPIGFRKNGDLLLRHLRGGDLLSYDSETQQIKYLGNSCKTYCSNLIRIKIYVDAYVESLVLLGDANRLGAGPGKIPSPL